jgi:diaminopimelate decarboxylase
MHARVKAKDIISRKQAASLIEKYGSPLYVYREQVIREKVKILLEAAQGFLVSYAVKANTNSSIVKLIK